MRRGIALLIGFAMLAPPTYASDLGAGTPGLTAFSLAAAASLVFLYALSKNRD